MALPALCRVRTPSRAVQVGLLVHSAAVSLSPSFLFKPNNSCLSGPSLAFCSLARPGRRGCGTLAPVELTVTLPFPVLGEPPLGWPASPSCKAKASAAYQDVLIARQKITGRNKGFDCASVGEHSSPPGRPHWAPSLHIFMATETFKFRITRGCSLSPGRARWAAFHTSLMVPLILGGGAHTDGPVLF